MKMPRRSFLKTLLAGIFGPCFLKKKKDRETIISEAMDTPEGRLALATAMVTPIRRALEYNAIGRKLLMVDELPQGAYARYYNGGNL